MANMLNDQSTSTTAWRRAIVRRWPDFSDPLRGPHLGVMALLLALASFFTAFLIWSSVAQLTVSGRGDSLGSG